jgi:hypothetical protein
VQLQTILDWLPQVAVTAIPGFINQLLAARELVKSLHKYPLFTPRKSPTYWLYRLFIFSIVTFLFWVVIPLISPIDPPSPQRDWHDLDLLGWTLAFSFFFPYFLNAPISLLSFVVFDIGPTYKKISSFFRDTIIQGQFRKTQDFWADLGRELRFVAAQTNRQNYVDGHQFLRDSLVSTLNAQKFKTSESPTVDLESRLAKILPKRFDRLRLPSFRPDLSIETIQLLEQLLDEGLIPRSRLPEVLNAIGCYQCAQRYFPKATKGSRSRR